jgi:hypothetical protein
MANETAQELLWAAKNTETIRWVQENSETISGLRTGEIVTRKLFPSEIYAADCIPTGWKVIEDAADSKPVIHNSKFKIVSFPKQSRTGDAYDVPVNWTLVDAKACLAEQEKLPPVESLDCPIISFPGTILSDPVGRVYATRLRFGSSGSTNQNWHLWYFKIDFDAKSYHTTDEIKWYPGI